MTTDGGPSPSPSPSPSPGAARKKRRPHPAAGGRILTAGLSTAAMIGVLAGIARSEGSVPDSTPVPVGSVAALPAATTDPVEPSPRPTIVEVVVRKVPYPVYVNVPAGGTPPRAGTAGTGAGATASQATTTARSAPTRTAPPPPPAPRPAPKATQPVSSSSGS